MVSLLFLRPQPSACGPAFAASSGREATHLRLHVGPERHLPSIRTRARRSSPVMCARTVRSGPIFFLRTAFPCHAAELMLDTMLLICRAPCTGPNRQVGVGAYPVANRVFHDALRPQTCLSILVAAGNGALGGIGGHREPSHSGSHAGLVRRRRGGAHNDQSSGVPSHPDLALPPDGSECD